MKAKRMLLYVMATVLFTSCGSSGGDQEVPTITTFNGTVASWTGDPNYAAVAAHENGEKIVAITESDASGNVLAVTGAIWFSPNGDSLVVYNGLDGLPERAIAGDYVILFENYTANTVDVGFVYPDGTTEIVRNVPIDSNLLSQLQARPLIASAQSAGLILAETLRLASLTISIAGCIGSIPTTVTGVGIALMGLACTSAIVSVINYVTPEDNPALEASGAFLGGLGCGLSPITGSVGSCISLILSTTATVIGSSETTQTIQSPYINQTEDSLLYGGTGNVKITLTWNNTADIDLWVTEPSGERIGYSHLVSTISGGMLDDDDTNGFGPENIYWPVNGAPSGTYIIKVNYYCCSSTDGTANYQVVVKVDGTTNTYTGSLTTTGQWITVTSFTR